MTTVAIQGIRGSYSEEAALTLVPDAECLECDDFAETFSAVRSGRADYAVVPVKNKIVGDIEGTARVLSEGSFRMIDQTALKIRHVLAGTPHAQLENIETVRSHMEALKQCRRYLASRPRWVQVIGADTASSVRWTIEQGNEALAAIGSRRAAEMYGAKILAEEIADDPDNWTMFYLLAR